MTLQKDPDGYEKKYVSRFIDLTGLRVLEIGCGEGRLTWKYASTTQSSVAIDLDVNALRVAKVDMPSDAANKVFLTCANSEYLPFSKEKFDIAILAWSL